MVNRSVGALAFCSVLLVVGAPPSTATPPGSNGAIAFSRNGHVWVIQADGTQTKIARGYDPAWSPDGTRIAYVRQTFHGSRPHIWIMAADGTDKMQVTQTRSFDASPDWSPDGSTLVYSRSGQRRVELRTISAEAPFGSSAELTDTPMRRESQAAWSPDGSRIAFSAFDCNLRGICGTRLGVVGADGTGYTLLTPAREQNGDPDWSPDSSTLLFTSDGGSTDDFDVFSMSASGGPRTRLTNGRGDWDTSPSWSPDGTSFVYEHLSTGGTFTLRISSLDGSSVTTLCRANDDSSGAGPDWQTLPVPRER